MDKPCRVCGGTERYSPPPSNPTRLGDCKACCKRRASEGRIKMTPEQAAKNKACHKRYMEKNKAQIRERTTRQRRANMDKWNERSRQWSLDNPERMLLNTARQRAKRRGIVFSISLEDIEIPEVCPVLKVRLEKSSGSAAHNSPSLDRIIPELGYVPGNVRVISWRANSLKKDATVTELKQLASYLEGMNL